MRAFLNAIKEVPPPEEALSAVSKDVRAARYSPIPSQVLKMRNSLNDVATGSPQLIAVLDPPRAVHLGE
jgi:hypothetical protein